MHDSWSNASAPVQEASFWECIFSPTVYILKMAKFSTNLARLGCLVVWSNISLDIAKKALCRPVNIYHHLT